MKTRYTILFVLFLISQLSFSQDDDYIFRTMSPKGGFYYDGVKEIEQDKDGFVWIMMDYELYRFDGYEYKRYYTLFPEWENASNWCFNSMTIDDSNRLYVGTNDGLYLYDKESDAFMRLTKSPITYVESDTHGNIWIKENFILGIYNLEKEAAHYYPLYENKRLNQVRKVLSTEGDDTYLLTSFGRLYRYNSATKEIILHHTQKLEFEDQGFINDAQIVDGKLWLIVSGKGLYKIDLSTLKTEYKSNVFVEDAHYVRSMFVDAKGMVWIGTLNGLFVLDPITDKIKHYKYSKDDNFGLPNNSIWIINKDNQNNLWIGTYSGGISHVNINEFSSFKSYFPQKNKLSYQPVSAFAEDRTSLWIGTEGGGINRMNKQTGEFDYYTINNGLTHNNIKTLQLDSKDNLWIGTFSGGLDYYNTKTRGFTHFRQDLKKIDNSLYSNSIRKLIDEPDSGLWIAYQARNTKVSFLSYKDHSIQHYQLCDTDNEYYIFDILRDREDDLWALTHKKILKLNAKTKKAEEVVVGDSLVLNGQTFCMDVSGNLWIGTIGKGLIEFDTKNLKYVSHPEILGHGVSSIFSISYSSHGVLWLGTDNGLFSYTIKEKQYARYDSNDGAQGSTYYPLSAHNGDDGKIYFGGTNGFTTINKTQIAPNNYAPNIIFTDFVVDNNSVKSLYKAISEKEKIVLSYDEANFSITFSSDNYLIPEKNKFKYRLKGYDSDWKYVNSSTRFASYSKVPAGSYIFEITSANNDGIWNENPTEIEIVRKAAPWFSWYAYLTYALLFIVALYAIYYYYTEKKRLKLELYLDRIEKNKKGEIHESQLRFFTNISHDFRTPLSLIIGIVDKLRSEGLKEYYYRILYGNSQRLLNLVNELMDFRAVENGKMNLEVEKVNIHDFIEEVSMDFTDYAKQRNVNFEIHSDINIPQYIYADKYIMEKVLMNLLNNAFKYTNAGGSIFIETYHSSNEFKSKYENSFTVTEETVEGEYFSIAIRDTGVGISKESISSVFERFYKVKTVNFDSHLGTGIGLALVKSLTLLHKGYITIYSQREEGTDIVVNFPINKNSYSEAEMKVEEEQLKGNIINESNMYELPDEETEGLVEGSKNTILVAEDNEDLRKLIVDYLSEDYNIVEAEDGQEAGMLLKKHNVDIIISDIMMPIKDGIAFCADVKGNIETSHIPFIMLSAKTSVESKMEGADSGADIYFEKPLNYDLLKKNIENILKQRELLKEYFAKNYFADSSELSINKKDKEFLKGLIVVIEEHLDDSALDVNFLASKMYMSRSKMYNKIKSLTGKSIVEFLLNYRMRKAARLIIEEDMTMREVMMCIGIESQPYFTNAFKREFGMTPTQFATENKNNGEKQ